MKRIQLTAIQTIAAGFAAIILIGALLLMLPVSNRAEPLGFLNALFTSTSATCVTGLVVCDTWSQFTLFGQIVLLLLIQLGGLGFVTVMVLLMFALDRRIGLRERALLSESISFTQVGGVLVLVRRVLIGTALAEGLGAVLLSIRMVPRFGWATGIWYGVFHSVSAFCNAGFDLMGRLEPYSSFTWFRDDWLVNLVLIALILTGGIGFVVWSDLWDNRLHVKKWALHTKLMLFMTGLLTLVPFVLYLLSERNGAMAGLTVPQRIIAALFQTVTPRTAGMNTIDLASLSPAGTLLTVMLMFIGAGVGSTGGGVKVTTFSVTVLAIWSYMRGRKDLNVFRRRVEETTVRRAVLTTVFYFLVAAVSVLGIELVQGLPLPDVLMEVFSALGTVGLSTGLTRELNTVSRIVIMILMYSGRVGSLTVLLSVSERKPRANLRNPAEKIIVS